MGAIHCAIAISCENPSGERRSWWLTGCSIVRPEVERIGRGRSMDACLRVHHCDFERGVANTQERNGPSRRIAGRGVSSH